MNQLVQRRKTVKQRVTRLQTFIESNPTIPVSIMDVQIRLEKLEECSNLYNDIQTEIEALCTQEIELEEQEQEREAFENKFFAIKGKMCTVLKSAAVPATLNIEISNTNVDKGDAISKVRLPTLELPTFNGNFQDWFSFFDLFMALVHNNATLVPAQKLHYLKSSLRGDAQRLLASVQVTDANYEEAWKILKDRYQNKKMIIQSHISSLFTQPNLHNESAQGLRKLLDNTLQHVRALHVLELPTDHWDAILVHLVVEKMDCDSRRQWELSCPPITLPTFEELKAFLEIRCRALEASNAVNHKQNGPTTRVRQPSSSHLSTAKSFKVPQQCPVCKLEHVIYQCPKLLQESIQERSELIKQLSLCFNCLRSKHVSRVCTSTGCRKCGRKHHTLLHQDQLSPESSVSTSVNNHSHGAFHRPLGVLLATALIRVKDVNGIDQPCRALLDSGSQNCFISEMCTQRLGLPRKRINLPITGIGSVTSQSTKGSVNLQVSSNNNDFNTNLVAFILPRVTCELPNVPLQQINWSYLKGIDMADPTFDQLGPIDVLLGADIHAELFTGGKILGPPGAPTAQSTVFGWIVSGKVGTALPTNRENNLVLVNHSTIDIGTELQRFWQLEDIPCSPTLSMEEQQCEDIYERTHTRDINGRYVVKLPFRTTSPTLGCSKQIAASRFRQVEKQFEKNIEKYKHYSAFMKEYLELGHMSPISPEETEHKGNKEVYYLPHHAVYKETSGSPKIRVVFDGSAKTSTGVSLNDKLLVGPKLQDNLLPILLRFRQHKIAMVADIEKMYRQVMLNSDDTDYQRILWRDHPSKPVQEFRLLTVTYGTASASYLAIKSLRQLALDEGSDNQEAVNVVLRDFYVDDLISGANTLHEAFNLQDQVSTLLKKGGFHLKRWSSNNPQLLTIVEPGDREPQNLIKIDNDSSIKILGLHWNPTGDYFVFSVQFSPSTQNISKREILSRISRIFDPLGWLSPIIITAKIIMQRLWLAGTNWDDQPPLQISQDFSYWCDQLPLVRGIKINRCVTGPENTLNQELHGFCDASERAYCAVIYSRVAADNGGFQTHLLVAKTKVAPVKPVSLPRLELCGAVLLARLLAEVRKSLVITEKNVFAWTDSTIVLSWLKGYPSRWKVFVANRVVEIQGLLPSTAWNHVSSGDNPADCASRGIPPSMLLNHTLWWYGPSWLRLSHHNWPSCSTPEDEGSWLELKPVKPLTSNTQIRSDQECEFSSLTRLQRVTAYCLRYINNSRVTRSERLIGRLTINELRAALTSWIKRVQLSEFPDTIIKLSSKLPIHKKNPLLSLSPFLDSEDVLRVGGRLHHSRLSYDSRHPVILPKSHKLTELIITHEHKRHLHGGLQLVLAALKRNYWIIHARDVVRRNLHRCVTCARHRVMSASQQMGSLPHYRVEPARPFLRCGVDYGGPLLIKDVKGRGRAPRKAYICLFVCMAVKAVHLELVGDLTTAAFLGALKRFVARRGLCTTIYSDNGTNFIGAKRELKELRALICSQSYQKEIANQLATVGISWNVIPPGAPHFGGLWESGIKSMKYHLHRIVGNNVLTFEEMSTFLVQTEACMNSRPIAELPQGPDDLEALTPGHFLIGGALTSIPEPDLTSLKVTRLSRWQLVQQLSQHFWRRWHAEYLSELQQKRKWRTTKTNLKEGDLVLIKEENLPRLHWKLGRVIQTHPGRDGQVRVVTLKTSSGTLKRPIVKVCLLPVDV